MRKLNKLLRQAQQSCSRLLVSHCHRGPCVVTYSDAAWAVRRKGESQAGYLTGLADAESLTGQEGPLWLVSWHSGRCQRIARWSAEVQAAGDAQEEEEHVRLVIVDLLFQDMVNANEQIARLPGASAIDCQALFDGVSRSESSALGLSDKRSALESMALQISLFSTKRSSAGRCSIVEEFHGCCLEVVKPTHVFALTPGLLRAVHLGILLHCEALLFI